MPALGLLEFDSIAVGIRAGDAMVKRAPVRDVFAGTVHPGKYLVYVGGDVASVEEAVEAGLEAVAGAPGAGALLDQVLLPDPHPQVVPGLGGARRDPPTLDAEAVGIVETRTVASIVGVADRGLKGAEVELRELRVADHLGGKSYCLFQGSVADVEAAVELAVEGLHDPALLIGEVVIPRIHDDMLGNLSLASEFAARFRAHPMLQEGD